MTYAFNFKQHTPAASGQKVSENTSAFIREVSSSLGIKCDLPAEANGESEDTAEANQSQTERARAIRSMIDKSIHEANEYNRFVHSVRKQLGLKAAF